MIINQKRINIFCGHFGSGKTEVAVNYALKLNEIRGNTAIADIDIVNPFFRTADAKTALEKLGIKVVLPVYANTNVDVPALPAELNSLFENSRYNVVLDVGGDDLGAKAIGRYSKDIAIQDFNFFIIVNTNRPYTCDVDKIIKMIDEIEKGACLKTTALINNANFLQYTSYDDIKKGYAISKQVSDRLKIPVAFSCIDIASFAVKQLNEENIKDIGDILFLKRNILVPF